MLPVAIPPNAIDLSSGYIKISDRVKTGIWMNIISIVVIVLAMPYLLPLYGMLVYLLPLEKICNFFHEIELKARNFLKKC